MQFLSLKIVSTIIFLLLHSFLLLGFNYALFTPPNNEIIPAVIVFGDSIVDPGNNNNLATLAKANFLPYGRDFMGGKPTGRFSNGKIPSDLLVDELGIKETLPAYLEPNLQVEDLLTGVSFASGGAGYDPLTSEVASAISLSDQLHLFKEYTGRIRVAVGEERTNNIVSKSIYLVCVGSDDIANTYTPFRKAHYDIPSYTDLMAKLASSFLQELYGSGARRIFVASIPPIGCVPSQRTLGGGISRQCADNSNQAAILFNSKLSSQLDSLNAMFPDAKFVYLDVYTLLLDLFLNPTSYGFQEAEKGCCGTGIIEVTLLCNKFTPNTCTDVSKYVFWDSYHPTEGAYNTLRPLFVKYLNKVF